MTDNHLAVLPRGPLPLTRVVLWSVLALGVLTACGPTDSSSSEPPRASSAPEALSSASTPTVSPELSIPNEYLPPFVRNIMPAVAAGNGMYLVVFTQVVSSSSPAVVDIYGIRVRASDGAQLDPRPFLIAGGQYDQVFPAVAFDGTNFLVVWNDPPLVYGVRVRASDGAVLGTPIRISNPGSGPYGPPMPHFYPSVAFDGTHYLVVWNGAYYQSGNIHNGILGSWVRASDGQLVDSLSFIVSPQTGSKPRVAYGGGRYLVTWSDSRNSETPNVYGMRIDAASRQVLDAAPRPIITTTASEEDPAVASDGSDFLVVWRLGGSGLLQKTRVRGSDGAVLDFPTTVAEASAMPASVTFDGRDYRVAWLGVRDGVMTSFTTRVPANGGAGQELLVSSIPSTTQPEHPGIAATAEGHFLVLYTQFDSQKRIKARLVQDVQPEQSCEENGPTLVLNGAAVLTLECGSGAYSDPGAQAFDGCGNPLTAHAYNTGNDSSGPGPQLSAEGSYLVSYAAWDSAGRTVQTSRTVVVEDRVAPTLTLNGPAHMVHTCNTAWTDPGVTAIDACYGNVSNQGWRAGDVNAWAEGTYTVTYHLTDSGGNSAVPVTRTVEVVDCPW